MGALFRRHGTENATVPFFAASLEGGQDPAPRFRAGGARNRSAYGVAWSWWRGLDRRVSSVGDAGSGDPTGTAPPLLPGPAIRLRWAPDGESPGIESPSVMNPYPGFRRDARRRSPDRRVPATRRRHGTENATVPFFAAPPPGAEILPEQRDRKRDCPLLRVSCAQIHP